jgi:hypothetical protein
MPNGLLNEAERKTKPLNPDERDDDYEARFRRLCNVTPGYIPVTVPTKQAELRCVFTGSL